jgi:transposase
MRLPRRGINMDVSTYLIQHLGIVAGIYDLLGIGEVIDRLLPKQRNHKVPHSIVVKAMILNGLGFTGQRLYLFPNFFKTIPVEELLGESITADDLNDDVLLRTLDAIYNYGATELFNEIVLEVMRRYSLKTQLIHVDTTNFSVYGKYENDAPDGSDSIKITFGHAKDGRTDLKRFVLGLVTNQLGVPLFAQAYSGNESDKNSLIEMIQKAQKAISLDDQSIWVADSALYTKMNVKMLGTDTPWITRITANIKQSSALLNADLDMTPGEDQRYAFHATELDYGGIDQKAVVVWSEDKQKRDEKTLDRKIQKVDTQAKKELKTLQRMRFACAPDAENEAERWISDHPYHRFKDLRIEAVSERVVKKRGRPRKDEPMKVS